MSRIITALTGVVLAVALLPGSASGNTAHRSEPTIEVIATGLDNPRGLTVHNGAVYVAESGNAGATCAGTLCFGTTGYVTRIRNGSQERIINGLPSKGAVDGTTGGANDVAIGPWGQVLVPFDLGGAAAATGTVPYGYRFGTVERVWPAARQIGDLRAWETANDPDSVDPSTSGIESNPFSVATTWYGTTVVSDAAANDLIKISPNGELSTLALFPSQCVAAIPNGPPGHPACPAGQIRQQSVPTGVAIGPDGAFYVGEMTGFPFTLGTARIWRITRDGQMSVVATGLTTVIDIAFDRRGRLYALQYKKGGFFSPDLTGSLVRVGRDGTLTTVLDTGLVSPTGLAFGRDGAAYIAHRGVPNAQAGVAAHTGEVLKVRF
ncbi:MAG TPA: ScyD/ScyE family protein [Actinophytocola sp.]|uniref:ScyD/ScyE family protein n=1 Tax=Actinophytocola sp. TaxID=1872138 RepID=UPI002DDD57CC|nr:ScyD/ScyE family protein [Actinophytocola sp.]HEV2780543.1 ScyD/ScyE family protein [Actinophytocola sp.]